MTENIKSNRGFAAMSPERQRAIASKGGKAAHEKGTSHKFSAADASAAGKKGGSTVSSDRAHMAEIGRKGGLAARTKKAQAASKAEASAREEAAKKAFADGDVYAFQKPGIMVLSHLKTDADANDEKMTPELAATLYPETEETGTGE